MGAEIAMWVGLGWLLHCLYTRWDDALDVVDDAMRWLDRDGGAEAPLPASRPSVRLVRTPYDHEREGT